MSDLNQVQSAQLLHLARRLLTWEPQSARTGAMLEPICGFSGITGICLFDGTTSTFYTAGVLHDELQGETRASYLTGQDRDEPALGQTIRRLETGGRITGAVAFEGLQNVAEMEPPLVALVAALHEGMCLRRNSAAETLSAEMEAHRTAIFEVLGEEFKVALTTILAATGGLRNAGPLLPAQLEMARMVEDEASRMAEAIARLDRIARLNRDEVRPRMNAVNVTDLIAEAVSQCSAKRPDRKIELKSDGPGQTALADAELIRLAFSQMLHHACDSTDPGAAIQVALETLHGTATIRVLRPHRNPSSLSGQEQPYAGTRGFSGTALHIAQKIAIAHAGMLDFDSPSEFHFTLPLAQSYHFEA